MRSILNKIALTAGISLATALTLSCSGEDGSDGKTPVCDETTGFWEGTTIQCVANSGKTPVCDTTTGYWQGTTIQCVAEDGDHGNHGLTPDCNETTKTWFVGTTDTEKKCIGEDGTHAIITTCDPTTKKWFSGTENTGITCVPENGNHGIDCDVSEDGAFFVMECGGVEKARWGKAYCGAIAYDPDELLCEGTEFTAIVDKRDHKAYKTVTIGEQTWMAENLNYNAEGSVCYSENSANCTTYGRLYDWATALTACPAGFHLPIQDEWEELRDAAGGAVAGQKLKADNDELWTTNTGTDDYEFAAIPGGSKQAGFTGLGVYGMFWTATENDANPTIQAIVRTITGDNNLLNWQNFSKAYLASIRSVKD